MASLGHNKLKYQIYVVGLTSAKCTDMPQHDNILWKQQNTKNKPPTKGLYRRAGGVVPLIRVVHITYIYKIRHLLIVPMPKAPICYGPSTEPCVLVCRLGTWSRQWRPRELSRRSPPAIWDVRPQYGAKFPVDEEVILALFNYESHPHRWPMPWLDIKASQVHQGTSD